MMDGWMDGLNGMSTHFGYVMLKRTIFKILLKKCVIRV